MGFGEMMLLSFVVLVFIGFFFLGMFTFLDWVVQWLVSGCLLSCEECKQVRIAKIAATAKELSRKQV